MKIKQIVEHKKGVRAMKYTKKTKSTVPVYGPDANNAKLKPVKPTGTVSESEVTLKPMPGAQEVDIDGKAVGTATTPAAATAIADLAKKGEFTPANADGSTQQPTMETGDDEEDHPSKHHFHDWLNSEDAPFDDEAGDDKAVVAKAMQYLHGRVHPDDREFHAHHMAHMYHGGDIDEAQFTPDQFKAFQDNLATNRATANDIVAGKLPAQSTPGQMTGAERAASIAKAFGAKPTQGAKPAVTKDMEEVQSPFPSRNPGTPAAAEKAAQDAAAAQAAAPAKPVQSAVYPSRNTVKEDDALLDKMLTIAGLR
jgi:hypothetical protein